MSPWEPDEGDIGSTEPDEGAIGPKSSARLMEGVTL